MPQRLFFRLGLALVLCCAFLQPAAAQPLPSVSNEGETIIRHPDWGSGRLIELDVSSLSLWTPPIFFKAASEETIQPDRPEPYGYHPRSSRPRLGEGLARFFGGLGHMLRAVSGDHKARTNVYPQHAVVLSPGATNLGTSQFRMDTFPENYRLKVFIPFGSINHSREIHFTTYGDAGKPCPTVEWIMPPITVRKNLKDLLLTNPELHPARMHGVSGSIVTMDYDIPGKVFGGYESYLEATLDGSSALNFVPEMQQPAMPLKAMRGTISVFVPDARVRENGNSIKMVATGINGVHILSEPITVRLPERERSSMRFTVNSVKICWTFAPYPYDCHIQAFHGGMALGSPTYIASRKLMKRVETYRPDVAWDISTCPMDTVLLALKSGWPEPYRSLYYFTLSEADLAQKRLEKLIPFPSEFSDRIDRVELQIQSFTATGKSRHTRLTVRSKPQAAE